MTAQPIRRRGKRPCTRRSKARGTSGTRPGNLSFSPAGGVPAVSVVGHARTAPFDLSASMLTHGERSGAALRKRLGRLDAPSAIRAAVRGSPPTICNRIAVRRSKFSEKKRAMAWTGCDTRRSTFSHGRTITEATAMIGGTTRRPNQAAITMCCRVKVIASPAATITARPERMTSGAIAADRSRYSHDRGQQRAGHCGRQRKEIDELSGERIDGLGAR